MKHGLAALLLAAAVPLAGCNDTITLDEPDGGADVGDGADVVDTGADLRLDASDGREEPAPVCVSGIDEDGDGVCDREAADWSRDARLPEGGDRSDIYGLGEALPDVVSRGLAHTLTWPVDVSGILLPWRPLEEMLRPGAEDPETVGIQAILRQELGFGDTEEMWDWLGLARWDGDPEAMAGVPWPGGMEPGQSLGFGLVQRPEGPAMTFSCATCHTANLFGRTVVGMTNRRAQANEFFHLASSFFPDLDSSFFRRVTDADDGEVALFERAQENFGAVATRLPMVRGLDTSLAQVALSLSHRAADEYASRDEALERVPRENLLRDFVADSKPMVWWTLRYKTRWLADGSIVSGNPVFTNFLWNEIGRGTDLHELEAWLDANQHVVDELTAAVFATEAPRWVDWFGEDSIDLDSARRGQVIYEETCASCHGSYTKGWDLREAGALDRAGLLATVRLDYHEQTPVYDVGTDPQRAEGMTAFADRLNDLAISEWMGTVVEVQDGYVPPPLDGIWARYPYLHNQSVPTLCDLLLPAAERTATFWMGPADDAETDFDADCVGYPRGEAIPDSWQADPRDLFDTSVPGLTNAGHDEWLLDRDGEPTLTERERMDLIEFLKTL
jgi:mono/diheme cytochrome c family protein